MSRRDEQRIFLVLGASGCLFPVVLSGDMQIFWVKVTLYLLVMSSVWRPVVLLNWVPMNLCMRGDPMFPSVVWLHLGAKVIVMGWERRETCMISENPSYSIWSLYFWILLIFPSLEGLGDKSLCFATCDCTRHCSQTSLSTFSRGN